MKKRVIWIGILFMMILFVFIRVDKKQAQIKMIRNTEQIKEIKKHYAASVISIKNSNIYKKENNQYVKCGMVFQDTILNLAPTYIQSNTKYFPLQNTKYYIEYQNVEKTSLKKTMNQRFKNYLYFDEKIITKPSFSLYQEKKKYTFDESMEFSILIKEDDRYGVVYQDELYYIVKDDVKNIEKNNKVQDIAKEIPVTVYHFLYLENETCDEIICHPISQIREQFSYLKENHYFTLTTKEMEYFIKGKINLPKKSILITIDDGAKAVNFLPLLEQYQLNATLFLVSSWYPVESFKSNYLELASHTHNLHNPGVCSGGQGSPLKCMNKEELLQDLALSRKTLNQTEAFCFPFYEYNDYAMEVVKEAGFHTAYIGGDQKASIGTSPYQIPRITIHKNTSLDEYIHLIE